MNLFKKFLLFFALSLFLVITVSADLTATQYDNYYGLVTWSKTLKDTNNRNIMTNGGRIRPMEIVTDSYGKSYHYIVGAASNTDNTIDNIITIPMDVAGYSKCSINIYAVTKASPTAVNLVAGEIFTTGGSGLTIAPLISSYPASRLIGESSPIAMAPFHAGKLIGRATGTYLGVALTEDQLLSGMIQPVTLSRLGYHKLDLHAANTFILSMTQATSAKAALQTATHMIQIRVSR